MREQAKDERPYDPANGNFDTCTGIWPGPNGEQIDCCERCSTFPFVTLITENPARAASQTSPSARSAA
ncbi:hypothetical protein AB0C84_43540 [Actinomadura sp. NPDC048955]|uniref:hypothetical protein n=1 Tax=Actinomadura sp. NPDC048955 TaxID=3158228 RepID=UPI0033CFFAD1